MASYRSEAVRRWAARLRGRVTVCDARSIKDFFVQHVVCCCLQGPASCARIRFTYSETCVPPTAK